MEIITRRKSPIKDKHLLPESTDVMPASTITVWKSWTGCLVLACICTIFTVIWLDGSTSEAKMTVNVRQITKLPAISLEEDNPGIPISLSDDQRSVYVQDAVVFPDNVMLLVKVPDSVDWIGNMESLECRFAGMKDQNASPVISIKPRTKDLYIVRCSIPGWVKEFPGKRHKGVSLGIRNSDVIVQSAALYNPFRLPKWDYVVYESLLDTDSIVLLVKGLVTRSSRRIDINYVRCVFGKKLTSKHLFETRVLTAVQEVVRCEKPPPHLEEKLRGYHMSIAASWLGVLPSVVYYNPDNKANFFMQSFAITSQEKKEVQDDLSSEDELISSAVSKDESSSSDSQPFDLSSLTSLVPPKRKLCACTMIWNKARFFREWVVYHSYMGVERYFLYDNDSDDNIEEVVESLAAHNISRMIWPWIKTQQAAFSHCTILARDECEWVMFVDVDEYIYPMYYLTTSNGTSTSDANVLHRMIDRESEKAAQHGGNLGGIEFDCHNFGPSGLAHSPKQGVTVGYTCRLIHPERHKSIVRLAAVNDSLLNVLHHFELRNGYHTTKLLRNVGVVNHYKFQAWDVFKMKFVRRAGTYTTDWQKSENTGSKDRTPGLGTEAVKPDDWEKRFCEIEDGRLAEFVLRTFRRPDQPDKLVWEDQ
ncbi:hypothetical protein R1sor_018343 [Riccia sorocarpa]|uniref:Glycosyltransferase family 92 protein n=1 Tax=Riccia sorocarpa TaxID=122646 RepID=A0ABD3IAG4_9MARC